MRFSILQLLILVSFTAVVSVSLKFAGPAWWTGLSAVGLLLYFGLAIMALVGRGESRRFAIGFVACCTLYGVFLHFFNVNGLSAYTQLPTARALAVVYSSIATESVPANAFDNPMVMMGIEVEVDDEGESSGFEAVGGGPNAFDTSFLGVGSSTGGMGSFGGMAGSAVSPNRTQFMLIGHLHIALLLGWIGGLFARWVHLRQPVPDLSGEAPS